MEYFTLSGLTYVQNGNISIVKVQSKRLCRANRMQLNDLLKTPALWCEVVLCHFYHHLEYGYIKFESARISTCPSDLSVVQDYMWCMYDCMCMICVCVCVCVCVFTGLKKERLVNKHITLCLLKIIKMWVWWVGETGVSWHVFQKNAHKTQESLISGMSDALVKR